MVETGEDTGAEGRFLAADRARRQNVIAVSRAFLTHLGALVRQLQVHDASNSAVRTVLEELSSTLREIHRTAPVITVVFAESHTFVNGVWVRCTGRAWESATFLSTTLQRLGARGLRIEHGIGAPELLSLTQFLRKTANQPTDPEIDSDDIGIVGVRLVLRPPTPEGDETDRSRFRIEAAELLEDGFFALDRSRAAKLDLFLRRRQRALVIRLVQMAEETPEDLLMLTAVRDPTVTSVAHNLMVAILSIALGRLMDLRRRDLVRLGVCALSHNVGEALLPEELFTLETRYTDAEMELARRHPLMGMSHLLEHFGFDIPIVERALASAEHHIQYDGGGYPQIGHGPTHVFARIISIADVYNALVSPRPRRDSYPPDQAVKLVNRKAVRQLDPLLVRMFVRLVGRYPPGSLVELDSGEFGVVVGPGGGLHPLTRPRVILLTDSEGFELARPVLTDLGARHDRRRAWLRTIVRTRDPSRLVAPVSRYLLADRDEPAIEKMDVDDPTLQKKGRPAPDARERRRFEIAGHSSAPADLSRFGLGVTTRVGQTGEPGSKP